MKRHVSWCLLTMTTLVTFPAAMALAGAPTAKDLTAALSSRDANERAQAAAILGRMGKAGAAAVPKLIALLRDNTSAQKPVIDMQDTADRRRTVMGPDGLTVNTTVAREAAMALARIGDPKAAELLLRVLANPDVDFDVRDVVEKGLVDMGDGALKALTDIAQKRGSLLPTAARVLGLMGTDGATVLAGMLPASKADAGAIALALGESQEVVALKALTEALKSKDAGMSVAGLLGLQRHCREGQRRSDKNPVKSSDQWRAEELQILQLEAVQPLIAIMLKKAETPENHAAACDVLKMAADPRSVPALCAALSDKNEKTHYGAFYAIWHLATRAKSTSGWFDRLPDKEQAAAWQGARASLLQALQADAVKALIEYLRLRSADKAARPANRERLLGEISNVLKDLTKQDFPDHRAWATWWSAEGSKAAPKPPAYTPPGAAIAPPQTQPASATQPAGTGGPKRPRRRPPWLIPSFPVTA